MTRVMLGNTGAHGGKVPQPKPTYCPPGMRRCGRCGKLLKKYDRHVCSAYQSGMERKCPECGLYFTPPIGSSQRLCGRCLRTATSFPATCRHCGAEFRTSSKEKYCPACNAYRPMAQAKGMNLDAYLTRMENGQLFRSRECPQCGKEFEAARGRKYCSIECRKKFNKEKRRKHEG